MANELNQLFLYNPVKFLKEHLIVACNFDTNRGFYKQFQQYYVEFHPANVGRREKTAIYNGKFMRTANVRPVRVRFVPKAQSATTPHILGQYVPYLENRVCWEKIHSYTQFVISYPFNGCDLFISKSEATTLKVMHACSNVLPDILATSLAECFGGKPFKKFPLKKYSGQKENDLSTIVGFKSGPDMTFAAQNFLEHHPSESMGSDFTALKMFKKLKR